MTLSEFRAWFEGYTEGLEGAPTAAQFARIKEKVAQISGTPITERVYVDRYVNPWRPYWDRYWAAGDIGSTIVGNATVSANLAALGAFSQSGDAQSYASFDSHEAMRELGRMEARN